MAGLRGKTIRERIGLLVAGVTGLAASVGLVAVGEAEAAQGCRVAYSVPSEWQGGFSATIAVTNLGDPVNGWKLTWTWPSGQQVTQAWNASVTSSGSQATAANVSYNAAIPTNGTVSFGLNATWTGTNTAPTSFALNGVTCTGGTTTTTTTTGNPVPGNAMAEVAAMQPGWNLGNSLDATGGDETSWGNPRITEALLDNVRAQGFKSIRIPVT